MKRFDNVLVSQFVEVRAGAKLRLRSLGVYLLLILAAVAIYVVMSIVYADLAVMAALLILVLGWFFTRSITGAKLLEYEYSFLDGEMDIARITNKERRKELSGFRCADVSLMTDQYNVEHEKNSGKFSQIRDYSSGKGENLWYILTERGESGRTLFILEPNEKILAALREYVPKFNVQIRKTDK